MWKRIKKLLRLDFKDQAIREIKEDEAKAAHKAFVITMLSGDH